MFATIDIFYYSFYLKFAISLGKISLDRILLIERFVLRADSATVTWLTLAISAAVTKAAFRSGSLTLASGAHP